MNQPYDPAREAASDPGRGKAAERGLRITDDEITSPATAHSARRLPAEGGWVVSWLPGRVFTRDQATTAMVLAVAVAEAVATQELTSEHPLWPHIDQWARELGLTGPDAVVRASEPLVGVTEDQLAAIRIGLAAPPADRTRGCPVCGNTEILTVGGWAHLYLTECPGCAEPASHRIEAYSLVEGRVHGRLDAAHYVCAAHVAGVEAAIHAAGMTAYRWAEPWPSAAQRCGDVFDYPSGLLGRTDDSVGAEGARPLESHHGPEAAASETPEPVGTRTLCGGCGKPIELQPVAGGGMRWAHVGAGDGLHEPSPVPEWTDPGPLPAVVEPDGPPPVVTGRGTVIPVDEDTMLRVAAAGEDLTALTIVEQDRSTTVALTVDRVDDLCDALAAAAPLYHPPGPDVRVPRTDPEPDSALAEVENPVVGAVVTALRTLGADRLDMARELLARTRHDLLSEWELGRVLAEFAPAGEPGGPCRVCGEDITRSGDGWVHSTVAPTDLHAGVPDPWVEGTRPGTLPRPRDAGDDGERW